MKLKTSTALATLFLFLPITGYAAELASFPDLETAKQAYRAEDYATAARHWMPLAHQGIPEAQVELGKLYSKGLGVVQNDHTALNLFMAAAEKDDERAMFEIGRMYENGAGVPKDTNKAKEWYRLAADRGYARGNYAIGQMYEKNKFDTAAETKPAVKENIKNAVNQIKDGNFSQAEYLATVYQQGLEIPKSDTKALMYLLLAEKAGSPTARAKIETVQTKISLDNYLAAQRNADILFAKDNKSTREDRKEIIRSLKQIETPTESPVKQKLQADALPYYTQAAKDGYVRADKKLAEISGRPLTENTPKPAKKNYRIITDLKTQFVGQENLDLHTRSEDPETALILDGKIGTYLYPTDDTTAYIELRGLYSTGSATSNNDDDEDTSDLSFAEIRQAWLEFDNLFGIEPAALKIGRQRFYEPRGLWWNRDLDAIKVSFDTTLTNGFIAGGENLSKYRVGNQNDLERDEEDRLRILGELSHQYAPSKIIEGRFLYEYDHSATETIGQNIPDNDRDNEDNDLFWLGIRAKGKTDNKIGYRGDLIGVGGTVNNVSTTSGPTPDLRTVSAVTQRDVLGWAFDGSIDYQFDSALESTITIGYAYGSGDDAQGDDSAFRQSDIDGNTSQFPEDRVSASLRNYGEVLRPELSNIHIANVGVNIPVFNASDASLNYFTYWLDNENTGLRSSGISAALNGQDNYLGQALDISTNINIGEELHLINPILENTALRIKLGGFQSGDAYGTAEDKFAYRGSSELRIRF